MMKEELAVPNILTVEHLEVEAHSPAEADSLAVDILQVDLRAPGIVPMGMACRPAAVCKSGAAHNWAEEEYMRIQVHSQAQVVHKGLC